MFFRRPVCLCFNARSPWLEIIKIHFLIQEWSWLWISFSWRSRCSKNSNLTSLPIPRNLQSQPVKYFATLKNNQSLVLSNENTCMHKYICLLIYLFITHTDCFIIQQRHLLLAPLDRRLLRNSWLSLLQKCRRINNPLHTQHSLLFQLHFQNLRLSRRPIWGSMFRHCCKLGL